MRTILELAALADTSNLLKEHPQTEPKAWIRLAKTSFDQADSCYATQNWEDAYWKYLHGASIILDVIPKHRKFDSQDPQYQQMRNKSTGIISKLETIKAHIVPGNDHNIDQSHSRQSSAIQQNQSGQANPNNLDQQTTHSNANQSSLKNYPGISTSHSQSSFVTNQASYMNNSNSNYTSNQQNVSTNGNYSQSNIAINSNSFANPGINSSKQSSSNNVTQPSGYKNSTANNSQQPLGTNGINSNNKLSGNQVVNQFLGNINQQSGNYVINENPGKQTSTPPTGRPSTPLDNKPSPSQNEKKNLPSAPPSLTKLTETISCSELNAILGNKPMKVLIFDIRPVEDYITGHIKWRSILLKPGVIAGGVINIEPTWLTSPHTVAEEIEAYLSSFGSTSNDLKKIFQSRNEMDLIVFYDDQSRTVSNPLFQKLFQSLYSNGSQMVLPKILSGGFEAWNNFICSSVSYIHGDWIEIGTGIGINDWTTVQKSISIKSIPITQTTHSRQSSSSPSSSMKSNVNYIPPAASNPIPTTVRSYQLGAGSNNSPQSSTDTATKTLDTADLRGADGKLDFQAMRKRLNSVGKSSEPQKQSENNPNTYASSVQFGEFTGASAASTDSSRRVTMLDPGKVNITSSPTNVSQHSNDDQSNTQSPVEFAKKQTESFRAPAVIKPRTSSIKKNDASSPILRKNTFDDPFFGFRRSTYTTAPEPAANIQPPKPPPKSGLYGLKEPLIGLPSRKSPDPMSSDLNAAYQKYPEISLSSVVATSEPIKVSYPTAHSRSNSPAPQVALSDFNSRYPSLEPPSIPSKPASMSSSYTGPTALQDPTINQARPVQQVGIPIPPPKPSNIASSYSGSVPSTSITNQMNNLQLNQPKPITNYSSLNNNNSNTNYLSLNNNFNVSKPLPPPQSQLTNQFKQVNDNTSYQNNPLPKPTLSNSTSMQMNQNGQPYKSLNNQPVNTNNPPPLPTKPGQSSEMGPFVQSQHPPRDSSLNVAIRPGQNNIGMLPKPLPVPGSYQSPSSMGPYYSHSSAPPPLMPKQGSFNKPPALPSRRLSVMDSQSKFGLSGLRNLGNTCFMNSIVQCLSATIPLSRYFLGGSFKRHIAFNNPLGSKGSVANQYASLIKSMWSCEESVFVPSEFKVCMGSRHGSFAGSEQQDSQEFLAFLLDQLHEDLNVAKRPFPPNGPELDSEDYSEYDFMTIEWQRYKARNWSIIVDMFQGTLKSMLKCMTCGKTSTTYNSFMYLTLPIPARNRSGTKNGPVTLQECLEIFLEGEIMDGDDAWHCPRCKKPRKTSKILSIVKFPTILLIHLKRFSFQGPFRDKLDTNVDFPISNMNMTPYIKQFAQPESYYYDLYAVSNHFGTLSGGHYTAQVKHQVNDTWYNMDDSRTSEISEREVKSNAAYLLFYCRTGQQSMSDWWRGHPEND